MKTDKREYITPVAEIVELDTLMMLAMSTSDEEVDTDGEDGGWSREHTGGSWNDIWGGM